MNTQSSPWKTYHIYGTNLTSDFPFINHLASGEGQPDLIFTCVQEAPIPGEWRLSRPLYISPIPGEDGQSILSIYHWVDCEVLHFPHVGDFYMWPDRIVCHALPGANRVLLEIHFFASVLSVWLERQGIPVLHASAVLANHRAIAFLASSTCGKSSLAAAWVQAGYPLLTDDILPMRENNGRFLGFPGHPQIRLWPDLAQHFLGQIENLERVHPLMDKRCIPVGEGGFGNYCSQPLPIVCFYLPERQGYSNQPEIEITPVSPRDGVIELVRHSFASRSVEALGYQPRRLEFFAHLARQVPMRRLVYPSGYKHLPAVLQAVLDDLARQ